MALDRTNSISDFYGPHFELLKIEGGSLHSRKVALAIFIYLFGSLPIFGWASDPLERYGVEANVSGKNAELVVSDVEGAIYYILFNAQYLVRTEGFFSVNSRHQQLLAGNRQDPTVRGHLALAQILALNDAEVGRHITNYEAIMGGAFAAGPFAAGHMPVEIVRGMALSQLKTPFVGDSGIDLGQVAELNESVRRLGIEFELRNPAIESPRFKPMYWPVEKKSSLRDSDKSIWGIRNACERILSLFRR